jgi:hypothetical protein
MIGSMEAGGDIGCGAARAAALKSAEAMTAKCMLMNQIVAAPDESDSVSVKREKAGAWLTYKSFDKWNFYLCFLGARFTRTTMVR